MHCLLTEHSCLHAESRERALCRVADAGIILLALLNDRSVITENGRKDKCPEVTFDLDGLAAFVDDVADRGISAAFNVVFLLTVIEDLNGHLVLCECTCLIGADNVYASKSLNCKEPFYDSIVLCHLCHTDRKDDRYDCSKTFRDSCDSK